MAWVAANAGGKELIFLEKPVYTVFGYQPRNPYDKDIPLPTGTIERLIGRPLTWDDEPVELSAETLTPKS